MAIVEEESASQHRPYQYDPIIADSSIRLLRRLSPASDGTLRFSLQTLSLDDLSVGFHCLSYTWGNPFANGVPFQTQFDAANTEYGPHATVPIVVDGRRMQVQRNLHKALSQLPENTYTDHTRNSRKDEDAGPTHGPIPASDTAPGLDTAIEDSRSHRQPHKLLWVDAVCINQGDVDEKSIQVTMMDRIYSRADYVVAWLGPDDQYSGSGLKALSTLASHMSQFTQSNIIPYKGTDSLNYEEAGIPIISPDEWTGLASLYKRQWCRRCWIIQEAVLPKLLLMYCGSHYISMDDLGAVASAIRQNETKLNTRDSVQYVPVNEAALPAEWNMIDVSTWRAELQAARETDAAEERARICEKSFTLPALVRNSWTFLASDARDKIYSLHGLINVFAPNKAEADYRQSIASVFTAAARQIIKQDGRLQIILTCIGLGQPRLDGLPSWVPDFSYPVSNAVPLVFRADAGLEYLEQGMGPPYSPVLHVQGLRVGKVTQVSDRLDPGPYRKFRMDASWLKMAASLRRNDSSGDGKTDLAYEAAAPLSDALWRTLCMNMTASSFADPSHYTEKPPPEFREEFHHLILLLICAGGDEKLLESVGLVNDQEIASTTIIHRARDALEDLAPVLDALDAINQHDGDQCVVPRRAYVERMWHDLIFTVRRVASAPANGQPIDFYPTPELKSGVDRLVGQGFVNASSGLFGMCKGFARAFSMAYSGRQLVTVDDRHLALAPLSARVGDEVWIIAGLSAPAVLRTATQSPGEHQAVADDLAELSIEDRGPARYEFVGGAYVHALMHGEAAKIWGTELQDIAMV